MTALRDTNGMYDSFMNSLLQVNPSTGTAGSAAVIHGYQLANVLAGPAEEMEIYPSRLYSLSEYPLRRRDKTRSQDLWTALSSGDKITFSGGVIVNVSLWQSNDKALRSTAMCCGIGRSFPMSRIRRARPM